MRRRRQGSGASGLCVSVRASTEGALWDLRGKMRGLPVYELRGAVVGFCGYGGIARETSRPAEAMGLIVWPPTRNGTTKKRADREPIAGRVQISADGLPVIR